MIRRRTTRINNAQIVALVSYFKQPPPAIGWDKAKKKSEVSKLLLDPRYTSLNRGQINNQLNGHILSAQLTMMVGAQMTVATDQMMDVQNGDTPNPLTAANVPFAQQHTLLILSELHETLNHEALGLPSCLPDEMLLFLRECNAALDRQSTLNEGEIDKNMPPDLQDHVDSISVWIICVVLPIYADAWQELAMVEMNVGSSGHTSTIISELEYQLNNRRKAETNVGGEMFKKLYSITCCADLVALKDSNDLYHPDRFPSETYTPKIIREAMASDATHFTERYPLMVEICRTLEHIVFFYYKRRLAALGLDDDPEYDETLSGSPDVMDALLWTKYHQYSR